MDFQKSGGDLKIPPIRRSKMEYWVADMSRYFHWFVVNNHSLHYATFWGFITIMIIATYAIFKFNLGYWLFYDEPDWMDVYKK